MCLLWQISPEDIQWVSEDPEIPHRDVYGGSGHSMNRSVGRDGVPGAGRGRGFTKGPSRKDFIPSQNGIGKKALDVIQILHTDTLVKEVNEIGCYHVMFSVQIGISIAGNLVIDLSMYKYLHFLFLLGAGGEGFWCKPS